jgi:hypothetical protein
VQPGQAQHYTKAAHYLRSGEVSVQRTPHGYTIQHGRNTVHQVVLNGKPHGSGIEQHTCSCQNCRVCWARALAQALVTRQRIQQGARKLAVLRRQVPAVQVARVVSLQMAA